MIRKGSDSNLWKGGRWIDGHGYVKRHSPTHPFRDHSSAVHEHRLIIELYYSIFYNEIIYLSSKIHIHHINENRSDNRIENLQILTRSQHMRIHYKNNKYPKKDFSNRICSLCKGKPKINNRGHEMWYSDINGFLCYKCRNTVKYFQKKWCLNFL